MATPTAFMNGDYIPLEEAKVGIMTHALHYGTAVFEGIRGQLEPRTRDDVHLQTPGAL